MNKTVITVVLALLSVRMVFATCFVDAPESVYITDRQMHEWRFPAADASKGRILLEFLHRLDYPRAAGWCKCWQVVVNGKTLTPFATRSQLRLVNKPLRMYNKHHGRYSIAVSDKWYSMYLPDFHAADATFKPATPEASRIVLDISDVVSGAKENVIEIRSRVPQGLYANNKITSHKRAFVVGKLKVRQETGVATLLPKCVDREVRAEFKSPKTLKYEVCMQDDALSVLQKGVAVGIDSVFSVPNGGEVSMGGKTEISTPFYSVVRRIERRAGRIDVFDTFTSHTNGLIGVKIRHEIPVKGFDPIYVAGDPSPDADRFDGGRNPSVFGAVASKDVGIAIIAQDDIFRVQNIQYCKDGKFGIRTDGLALKPGEPRTVEWSVYPVASSDYYDFVNEVRRDWDVNFTIDGGFTFGLGMYGSCSAESAQRRARNESLKMQCSAAHFWRHLPGKYASYNDNIWGIGKNVPKVRAKISATETVLEDPEVMNRHEREWVAKCKKFVPSMNVFMYIHNQISVDAEDEKYEQWRMVDSRGRKMFYGGKTSKLFVPVKDSLFARDFIKLVDWYCDTYDIEGLYLDEINHCNSRLYYGDAMWDGATVELDEKNNIKRKLSFVSLLKLDFTLQLFDHILNRRGKMMVGNFSPETRSERQFKFPRFEETSSSRWIALSHLYTPIQLGDMLTYSNTAKDMAADQRIAIKRGALYYHYNGNTGCPSLTSKMFPFTPVELHSGWLVGKERILTCVSGDFGWIGERPEVDLFVFDELGREVKNYPFLVRDTPQGRVFTLDLKVDHCAAIVKKQ